MGSTTTRRRWIGGSALVAVVLLGSGCAEETPGEVEADDGPEQLTRHLESLDTAYTSGSASEVESHLSAIDGAWDDVRSDLDDVDADEVRSQLDALEEQIDAGAPPSEVSATVHEITEAVTSP